MRFLATALFAILLPTTPSWAQPSRVACDMADQALVSKLLGAPAEIIERSDDGGVSFCKWQGGDGLYINITSITAESQAIVGGTPLEYFNQSMAGQAQNIGTANVASIDGPWQAGQITDVTTEPNPQQFYAISFINKDDTVTVDTFGLPKAATVRLAEVVAGAM